MSVFIILTAILAFVMSICYIEGKGSVHDS